MSNQCGSCCSYGQCLLCQQSIFSFLKVRSWNPFELFICAITAGESSHMQHTHDAIKTDKHEQMHQGFPCIWIFRQDRSMPPPVVNTLLTSVFVSHLCFGQLTTVTTTTTTTTITTTTNVAPMRKVKVLTFTSTPEELLSSYITCVYFIICEIRFWSSPTPLEAPISPLPIGTRRRL